MNPIQDIFINGMGLTEKDCEKFYVISRTITCNKKDFLLKEGNICSFIGFVEKGIVRSFLQKDDEEFNNDFFLPDSFFSAYRSFVTQTAAISTLQAMSSDTIVRLITYQQLQSLQHSSDSWYKFSKYIADQLFIRKCTKETSLLRDSASQRYESLLQSYPNIEQLVPQYQIASYLRIKPESLSRIKALTYINK